MSITHKMSWYELLFGIAESKVYSAVQSNFKVNREMGTMLSKANNRTFQIGTFTTPTLSHLRLVGKESLRNYLNEVGGFSFDHVVQGDVLLEHAKYPGALFQAASQFNCLEFPTWKSLPEDGVTFYAQDRTQGPACALACAAGTVYRNYFVEFGSAGAGVVGQTKDRQLNNLDELELALGNREEKYFSILNGYTFSDGEEPLRRLAAVIAAAQEPQQQLETIFSAASSAQYDSKSSDTTATAATPTAPISLSSHSYEQLLGLVKVGLHADVGVDFRSRFGGVIAHTGSGSECGGEGSYSIGDRITVTQAYCSALSCAYSGISNDHWEPLARLVLDANYEATLWAGVLNALGVGVEAGVGVREAEKARQCQQQVQVESVRDIASDGILAHEAEASKACVNVADTTKSAVGGAVAAPPVRYNKDVFLTFLGGGVFGNDPVWIADAIGRALAIMQLHNAPIRVHICHFRMLNNEYVRLIDQALQRYLALLSV